MSEDEGERRMQDLIMARRVAVLHLKMNGDSSSAQWGVHHANERIADAVCGEPSDSAESVEELFAEIRMAARAEGFRAGMEAAAEIADDMVVVGRQRTEGQQVAAEALRAAAANIRAAAKDGERT